MKFISAFLLGVMSSTHCLGMCGGISMALGMGAQGGRFSVLPRLFAYNSGRILCYAILGLLAGLISAAVTFYLQPLVVVLRVLSGLMLIAMGFYIAQWWMGLVVLEQAGQGVWKHVQPLMKGLMPGRSLGKAFFLGMCWGFLPCGLVYSVLVWSATSENALQGMLVMLAFGLGTFPAMIMGGFGGARLRHFLQHIYVRQLTAILLCAMGGWSILQVFMHGTHQAGNSALW